MIFANSTFPFLSLLTLKMIVRVNDKTSRTSSGCSTSPAGCSSAALPFVFDPGVFRRLLLSLRWMDESDCSSCKVAQA